MHETKIIVYKEEGSLAGYLFELISKTGFIIDWGDGCIEVNKPLHFYESEGIYTITITSKVDYPELTYYQLSS